MKKLLLAGLAGAAAVATVTPAAHATPTWHYVGGCGFFTISDGTETNQTVWTGELHAAVIATQHGSPANTPAPTASITIQCELRVNGVSRGIVTNGSATGTGAAALATEFTFEAHPDDIVTMCDQVTVNDDFHKDCGDATTTPIVPEPVQEIIEETVIPTVEESVEPTITAVEHEIDKIICPILVTLSGGPADQPPAFDIRSDGDIYVFEEFFWNCPPYESSGT